jgi:PAS domain S-box-containing protein
VPYFLWVFNARTGLALLLGNAVEDQHLHRPFEADDRGIIEGALSVFIDIVERKRIEEALQSANEELEIRVNERTAELLAANRQLQCELAERRRAEEALRQSKERFHQVISFISDHIYATEITDDGNYLNFYLSPHVESLTGYPYERFMADWNFWPTVVIHPDDRPAAKVQAAQLANGQSSEMEYRLVRANGEVIWVRDSSRVEWDPIRHSKIVYGVVSNITERKRVEEELAQVRDQALEASRLKTELLAKVSHELRTPLGAILGFSEILEFGIYGALSEKQKLTVAEIIDSTHYLTAMVSQLLDQAQLDAGKLKLNLTSFTPAHILDSTLPKMEVLAKSKGLSLTAEVAPELPITLTGDLPRLQQILVNLTSNAIKFTRTGCVRIHLDQPNAAHWAIRVTDTGIGIPHEAQTHLFEPFMQVDGSMTREQAGTGLGLSIVKQLVNLMGGEITLKSEVGQGSAFTVLLPLQPTQVKYER